MEKLLQHIDRKMTVYRGCTLHEILLVSCGCSMLSLIILSLLTYILFHSFIIGAAIFIPIAIVVSRSVLKRLGKIKSDKPPGYFQQAIYLRLSDTGLVNSPYLERLGKWSVRRTITNV